MLKSFKSPSFMKKFAQEEDGNMTVEAVLIMPILFWAIMASYAYFDGYRQSAANVKAAYTISDLVSRETREINDDYIDSMKEMMELMVKADSGIRMRITLITYNEADDYHYVRWSADRGLGGKLTDAAVASFRDQLPPMPDADTLILVETENDYVPKFDVGLNDVTFENFVFTRPRFTNEIAASV